MLDVLEVVDSPAESPKMCSHTKQTRARISCLKLQKLNSPVSRTGHFSFVKTGDNQGCRRAVMWSSSSGQVTSRQWRGMNHDNFRGCGGG
jgi:hypothetical protein